MITILHWLFPATFPPMHAIHGSIVVLIIVLETIVAVEASIIFSGWLDQG